MTDHELVQRAALACKFKFKWMKRDKYIRRYYKDKQTSYSYSWRPLQRTEDAMEIAATLRISIVFDGLCIEFEWGAGHGVREFITSKECDHMVLIRRGIVRAAAEMQYVESLKA